MPVGMGRGPNLPNKQKIVAFRPFCNIVSSIPARGPRFPRGVAGIKVPSDKGSLWRLII